MSDRTVDAIVIGGGIRGVCIASYSIAPWLSTFPGLVIMITVMAVNFIGDWLRDFLDPTVQNI